MRDEAHLIRVRDGGRERLAATVATLRRPASYSGEVQAVDAVETHMSWVFLTEAHAYKLKKPLCTAFFDYTTLVARRRACEVELLLNRRLAQTVYLAVVPVVAVEQEGGEPDDSGIRVEGGAGDTVDWLVKMRRLPEARMLDACIERDAVSEEMVEALADTLASFYARAAPGRLAGPAYRDRIAADIAAKGASLRQPRYELEEAEIEPVVRAQRRWLADHRRLLEARANAVVDAHGDLRPEHVCLERPPVVIDCLEFDPDLRALDPVSELAFLAIECRRLGAAWIGEQLLARYAARTNDAPPAHLIGFYQSYHALVRAAVAIWHLDDDALDDSPRWQARARDYLKLADAALSRSAP